MAPRAQLLGGIDLGGTKVQVVVATRQGEIRGDHREPTPQTGKPDDVAATIAEALAAACDAAGCKPADLLACGIGAPGAVDAVHGVLIEAPNLVGFDKPYPLAATVAKSTGAGRVILANDVQAGITGEHRLGAGKPYRNLLGVFWGTGIGGGIVLDDKLWRGRGAAGEIGHMVVRRGGARCGCGRRGCLEAYAGRASMEARARREKDRGKRTLLFEIMEKKGRTRLSSGVWAEAIAHGDGLATDLIERAIRSLGAGVASVQNALDLEAVVIGGGLGVRFGEDGARRIERAMHPHLLRSDDPPVVLTAGLGDMGGALGAALLALDAG